MVVDEYEWLLSHALPWFGNWFKKNVSVLLTKDVYYFQVSVKTSTSPVSAWRKFDDYLCLFHLIYFCYHNQITWLTWLTKNLIRASLWPSQWKCNQWQYLNTLSLQNKIWNLPDWSKILPKFIYGKEAKHAGSIPFFPVRVHSPALILKTVFFK